MTPNPFLGVLLHWTGGLAAGSFYAPYRFVRRWAWETYWLVGGVFSWIIAPSALAFILTNDLVAVLGEAPGQNVFWCYLFGAMWGLGGLTFGLTMRYLGMSLGMAVALGYCAAFGTLMPPIFRGEFFSQVVPSTSGQVILLGVLVCLAGITIAGMAGMSKERELSPEQKQASIKEFNFKKGLLVATFSGVMSASFSYGLAAGDPIKVITLQHGTTTLWQGLPVLVVVLLGGFTTNFIWCVSLNLKNRTGREYVSSVPNNPPAREQETIIETAIDAPSEEVMEQARSLRPGAAYGREGASGTRRSLAAAMKEDPAVQTAAFRPDADRVPLLRNYLFCALAGTTWYFQFFFYTMGETQMGDYKFSSWTLHMASIIIFSSLWGIALKEWRGTSRKTKTLLALGLAVLIGSTIIVGYGNYLGTLTLQH